MVYLLPQQNGQTHVYDLLADVSLDQKRATRFVVISGSFMLPKFKGRHVAKLECILGRKLPPLHMIKSKAISHVIHPRKKARLIDRAAPLKIQSSIRNVCLLLCEKLLRALGELA